MEDKFDVNEQQKPQDHAPKKKISKREVVRRILLTVFLLAFVYFAVQAGRIIYEYIEARNVSNGVIEGVSDITRPPSSSMNDRPIIAYPTDAPDSETAPDSSFESKSETEKPTPPEPVYSEYFSQWLAEIHKMKAEYPDFVGYIHIEGLDILYPVVQSTDNTYYLYHLINGKYNNRGEIFMDYRNNSESVFGNRNIVLYGHNLYDGTKFHNLVYYQEPEKFNNCPIEFITEDGIFTFMPFSFYKTTDDDLYNHVSFGSSSSFKKNT